MSSPPQSYGPLPAGSSGGDPGPSRQPVLRLPTRNESTPEGWLARLLLSGGRPDEHREDEKTYPWYLVLWLTGVDYFSTLGYQPAIALLAAGALAVPATVALILVTVLGAVPVYMQVAARSYAGQGSIALLENLLSGWKSRIFVLILLGFAATDFVITMTLSAADAARHAIANPFLHPYVGDTQIKLTLSLLLMLGIVFLMGFREAIGLATAVAIPYLFLNVVVLLCGFWQILRHPELLAHWQLSLHAHGDWTMVAIASALVFPRLALGLSGFETGVVVMPLVDGQEKGAPDQPPQGRIRNTRKLLLSAALIMSVLLLASGFVASLLIPEIDYQLGGPADGRAIAYLAHKLLGGAFGTVYDFSTILILWFAGASAMTGLLNLIPRYLPRFGMAPRWVAYQRPVILVLFAIDVVVTLVFRANVEAQGSAYATGVLVLILSAAAAVAIAMSREVVLRQPKTLLLAFYFWIVTAVFVYTLLDNVVERPAGVVIASIFIFLLLLVSAASRYYRATEMRISEVTFEDSESAQLWAQFTGKKVNLIPQSNSVFAQENRIEEKIQEIREYFKITGPLAFLHVHLLDNQSEFIAPLRVRVSRQGQDLTIEAFGAVAIANSIAYLSELLDPISIVLELTRRNLMKQSLAYVLWGEGEIGLTVYSILVRYWEFTKRTTGLPLIFLMSVTASPEAMRHP
jgi:hypothetical protein